MAQFEIKSIDEKIINELLEQATHLTIYGYEKEIKQADLRRAISSSYYALFHFLIIQSVNTFCEKLPLSFKHKVCRTFQHGEMSKICKAFIKEVQLYEKELEFQEKEKKNIENSGGKYPGKTRDKEKNKKEKWKYAESLKFPVNEYIKKMALTFPDMQEYRHSADYDLSTSLEKIDVLLKINEVEEIISGWRNSTSIDDQHNKNILLMLFLCKEFRTDSSDTKI